MSTRLVEFVAAKFPAVFTFYYRSLARILRNFPYKPICKEEEDGADWLAVRPSLIPNAGNGLFVTQFCPAGTVLCEYKGTRLTGWQLLRTLDWTYVQGSYEPEFWIDAGPHPKVKARYVNDHFDSSKWNVTWAARDEKVFIEAARDIQPGEELYAEYGERYWADHKYWKAVTAS